MRKCTEYINSHIPRGFSNDHQIIEWVQRYLESSWADQKGYLHYTGKVYKVHIWFDRIHVIDSHFTLVASISFKGFKKYVRRITQYQSLWQ